RRPPASRGRSRPRGRARSPRPRCGTDPAPSRARSACSVPCTRATARPPPLPGRRPPPCPTPDPHASRVETGRWSRSPTATPEGRRPRPASPTPAPAPDLTEDGRRGLRLLPSLHVEAQYVHEVLGVRHDAVRLVRAPVAQLGNHELRLVDANRREWAEVLWTLRIHEGRQHVADRDRMQGGGHEHGKG